MNDFIIETADEFMSQDAFEVRESDDIRAARARMAARVAAHLRREQDKNISVTRHRANGLDAWMQLNNRAAQ